MRDFTIVSSFLLVLMGIFGYLGYQDEKAFAATEVTEIHEIEITEVTDDYLYFLYWSEDNEVHKASIGVEDLKIGEEVALGVKLGMGDKFSPSLFGNKEIQYLYLPKEMIRELY